MIRPAPALFTLLALAACKPPQRSCERPDAPVQLQLLAASQRVLNPDEDGSPWPTNLRVYELKRGVDLQRLEFEAVYRDREKAFGEAFIRAHDYTVFPDRRTRWTLELSPETAHVVTVGLFRRPFGDAWYQVYDVPANHAARRCEAEERGATLPDPCVYLAFERSEIDGGAFPPAGFELSSFETTCAPVVHPAASPKKKKKRRLKLPDKLPQVPTIPELPQAPQAPELPQVPSTPSAPSAPTTPTAPTAPSAPSRPGGAP